MDLLTDIDALTDVEIFGTEALLRPVSTGKTLRVPGIFDAEYTSVEAGGSVGYATTAPRFLCAAGNLPSALTEGYRLVVNGVIYTIRVVEPDGTGMTALTLEKV